MFVLVTQLHLDPISIHQLGRVETPQRSQPSRDIRVTVDSQEIRLHGLRIELLPEGAFVQNPPRVPNPPIVLKQLQFHQLRIGELAQVKVSLPLDLAIGHLVDATAAPMDPVVIVALAVVRPVQQVDPAIRAIAHFHPAIPRVVGLEKVLSVTGDVSGSLAFQHLHVDPLPMRVVHEDLPAISHRPVVRQVDHSSAMRVAAAQLIGRRSLSGLMPDLPILEMLMIGTLVQKGLLVGIIRRNEVHPIARARDEMEELPVHVVGEEHLTFIVPIESPGVHATAADQLEFLQDGMVSPDARLELLAILFRSSHHRGRGWLQHSMAAPEPPVRPPAQPVHVIVRSIRGESIKLVLSRSIGHIVKIAIRNETQIRCLRDPHSAVPPFDSESSHSLVPKDLPLVETSVAVDVLQNDNAIPLPHVELFLPGVCIALEHPQAPPVVEGKGHRLSNVGLRRKQGDLESLRNGHHPDLLGSSGRIFAGLLRVLRMRPVVS